MAQNKKSGANYKMKGNSIIMPKFIRKNLEGIEYVHVTTHGIVGELIYGNANEKKEIRKLILNNQEKFNIKIIAYCIMSNHLHLLIKFKETKDLSNYMHKINTMYAIYYNKKHNRQGYVYKDRFHSQVIRNEKHLRNAIVYIHNNPVKANICNKVYEYEFSSYLDFFKDRENNTTTIFYSENQYKQMHDINDTNIEYVLNFEKISKEEIKEILRKYLNKEHITIEELQQDKSRLYEFCNTCKEQYKVSNRDLEAITKVSREKIRKLLMKKRVPKRDAPFGIKRSKY